MLIKQAYIHLCIFKRLGFQGWFQWLEVEYKELNPLTPVVLLRNSCKVKGVGMEVGLRASEGTPVGTGSEVRIEWQRAILFWGSSEAEKLEVITEGRDGRCSSGSSVILECESGRGEEPVAKVLERVQNGAWVEPGWLMGEGEDTEAAFSMWVWKDEDTCTSIKTHSNDSD